MFARQCTRLVNSRTSVPLTSYLARVRGYSAAAGSYEHILTSTPKPGVGLSMYILADTIQDYVLIMFIVTLNRPKALNALCTPLFKELNEALSNYDNDKSIGAIIITGSEKAFAGESIHYLHLYFYTAPLTP